MERRAMLGTTCLYTLVPTGDTLVVRTVADGKSRDLMTLASPPSQVWTEDDDLLLVHREIVRLSPDGAVSSAPPRVAAIAWSEDGRIVGAKYDAPFERWTPVDVRTGAVLGEPSRRPDSFVLVGEEAWRFEDGKLHRGGEVVPLARPSYGFNTPITACGDALVVRHEAGIDRVDREGRCTPIATIARPTTLFDRHVLADGEWVVWTESTEGAVELRAVPAHGGDTIVLATRAKPAALRLVDCYRGRVLVREESEVRDGVVRTRKPGALAIVALPRAPAPRTSRQPANESPTLHDDVAKMPIASAVAAKLRAAGITRVVDLSRILLESEPSWSRGEIAELTYAMNVYQRHVLAPSTPLRPIDRRFLAPTTDLELSPATRKKIAAAAPTLADVVTRTAADWLKTNGIARPTVAALEAALAERDMSLGVRWHELASLE